MPSSQYQTNPAYFNEGVEYQRPTNEYRYRHQSTYRHWHIDPDVSSPRHTYVVIQYVIIFLSFRFDKPNKTRKKRSEWSIARSWSPNDLSLCMSKGEFSVRTVVIRITLIHESWPHENSKKGESIGSVPRFRRHWSILFMAVEPPILSLAFCPKPFLSCRPGVLLINRAILISRGWITGINFRWLEFSGIQSRSSGLKLILTRNFYF